MNLTVRLDLALLRGVSLERFAEPRRDLWRYRALLPIDIERPVSLGEGATPLIHLERLGRRLGLPRLYAKDESQNPTWSYKDRLCAVAVTHAVDRARAWSSRSPPAAITAHRRPPTRRAPGCRA